MVISQFLQRVGIRVSERWPFSQALCLDRCCHCLRFILKHRPKKGPRNSHGILCECLMNGKSMHPQIVASITFASCSRPMFFVWFHMIQCPMENCNFQTNPISSMRKPGKLRQVTRASHHFPLPSPVHPGCCRAEKLRWPSPEWSRMVQNPWFSPRQMDPFFVFPIFWQFWWRPTFLSLRHLGEPFWTCGRLGNQIN